MVTEQVIQSALSIGLGVAGGGAFVTWLAKSYIAKVDKLIVAVTRLEATVKANESMKEDVRNHERRITLIEPKLSRAWEEIDKRLSKH